MTKRALRLVHVGSAASLEPIEAALAGEFSCTTTVLTSPRLAGSLAGEGTELVTCEELSADATLACLKTTATAPPVIVVGTDVSATRAAALIRAGARDVFTPSTLALLAAAVRRELERKDTAHGGWIDLALADRLTVVGAMAASIAHALREPISAVLANVEVAAHELEALAQPESAVAERAVRLADPLRDARAAAHQARQLVRALRLLSPSTAPLRQPLAASAEAALDAAVSVAAGELQGRATLVKQFAQCRLVQGQHAPIAQLCLELLLNASRAFPQGSSEANVVYARTRDEGVYVVIEIEDTGDGIHPDVLPRLFTPGATTRREAGATGLGLVMCRRLATALGGTLTLQSAIRRGTIARLSLPVATSDSLFEAIATPRPFAGAAPRRRVLVLDDEEMIARAVVRALEKEHELVVVGSAQAALAAIRAGPAIDAILCDMLLPDMTGMEFFAELSRLSPELAGRVIFMTGGAASPGIRDFLLGVTNAYVEKPFDVRTLRLLVQGVASG